MLDAFSINTVSYIFLLGVLVMVLGRNLPVRLILIVGGWAMSMIMVKGVQLFTLSKEMLYIILALSLPLLVFDSFALLRPASWHTSTFMAFRMDTYQIIAAAVLIGLLASSLFSQIGIITAIFMGIVITATSFYDTQRKVPSLHVHLQEDESRLSSMLAFTGAFLVISFLLSPAGMEPVIHILAGFGIGIIMGFILFRVCYHTGPLNHIILLLGIILTYMLSHLLTASGVFAVAGLGVFYASVITKRIGLLEEYTKGTLLVMEILLFASLGLIARIPLTGVFFAKVAGIYVLYLIIRSLSLRWTLYDFSLRERVALTLMAPKGAPIAAIAISLEVLGPHALRPAIPVLAGVVMLSLLVSYVYGLVAGTDADREKKPSHGGGCAVHTKRNSPGRSQERAQSRVKKGSRSTGRGEGADTSA